MNTCIKAEQAVRRRNATAAVCSVLWSARAEDLPSTAPPSVLLATLLRARVAPVVSAYARASSVAPSLSRALPLSCGGSKRGPWCGCACAPRKRHPQARHAARCCRRTALRRGGRRKRARARVSSPLRRALTRGQHCRKQAAASRAPWLAPLRLLRCSACLAGASTGAPTRQRGMCFQRALARRRCHRGARSRAAVAARACVRCLRCAPHAAPLGAAQRPARPLLPLTHKT